MSLTPLPDGMTLHHGWSAGLIGWVVRQHGLYYAKHWQLGAQFEALVAQGLGELMLRYNPETDCLMSLRYGDTIIASLTIDGGHQARETLGARLRYVIIDENWQSKGLGGILMAEAMQFLQKNRISRAYLTTFKGLDAARKLYERHNFRLVEENLDQHWGVPLFEQKFVWQAF
jgi:GNAT superfamily N-acetyltransferase